MSPLAPPGGRGYLDWQRIENWDGGLVINNTAGFIGNHSDGPFDVSRFASLTGFLACATAPVQLIFNWWADAAKTINLASFSVTLDPANTIAPCQIRIPNQGPYVTLDWAPATGATSWSRTARLIGSNRIHPTIFLPKDAYLLSKLSSVVPAGSSPSDLFQDYYAGPAEVYLFATQGSMYFNIDVEEAPNFWTEVWRMSPPAGTTQTYGVMIPPGICRMRYNNQAAGATTVDACVVGSFTGG